METIKAENLKAPTSTVLLQEYERIVVETDRFAFEDISPILLGLYGEVGGIMAASKKYRREKKAYSTYRDSVEEEFGDAIWYFAALCRRLHFELVGVFNAASKETGIKLVLTNNQLDAQTSHMISSTLVENVDSTLIELGYLTAQLLKVNRDSANLRDELIIFAKQYLLAMQSIGLTFSEVLEGNLLKVVGRFTVPEKESLPKFDAGFPEEEQLPKYFEIKITQRKSGQSYLRWNDVFIGSPLTDNMRDQDGYRFHDVFHLAYAAVLHWSPTFRALIKQKRKSDPVFDEAQDGGRAIVVEEGLTAWLFSYSKGLDYFEGHDSVSFDALKTIQKFVQGYEVEKCPLKLWEDAILQGYSVFRKVRKNGGGIVIGDRENRTITYRPIGELYGS